MLKPIQITLIVLTFFGAGASSFAFVREYRAVISSQNQMTIQAIDLAKAGFEVPLSFQSRSNVLDVCMQSLIARRANIFPQKTFEKIAVGCGNIAQQLLLESPTWSAADLVLASVYMTMGDSENANTALSKSRGTGQYQGWLVDRRLIFAISNFEQISTTNQNNIGHDFQILFDQRGGPERAAQFYFQYPAHRQMIEISAAKANASSQTKFLNALNRLNDHKDTKS